MLPEYRPARHLTDSPSAAGDFFSPKSGDRARPAEARTSGSGTGGRVRSGASGPVLPVGQLCRRSAGAGSLSGRIDTERAGHGCHLWVRLSERAGMWAAGGRPAKVGRIRGSRAPPVSLNLVLCVNARAALPCPKAPAGTAKRRLQAQQKSAHRYSRNSKRRLKAQQKSACKHSRPYQRRLKAQQKAPVGAFLTSVGTALTGADKSRMLPKRTWRACQVRDPGWEAGDEMVAYVRFPAQGMPISFRRYEPAIQR